jgi:biopolymer transport protein ExbD
MASASNGNGFLKIVLGVLQAIFILWASGLTNGVIANDRRNTDDHVKIRNVHHDIRVEVREGDKHTLEQAEAYCKSAKEDLKSDIKELKDDLNLMSKEQTTLMVNVSKILAILKKETYDP